MNRPFRLSLCMLLIMSTAYVSSPGAEPGPGDGTNENPYRVPHTSERFDIDARLDEPAWKEALILEANIEVQPGENIPAPVRTKVHLLYDETHLYVAFISYDPDPAKRSFMLGIDHGMVRGFGSKTNTIGTRRNTGSSLAQLRKRDWRRSWSPRSRNGTDK